MRAKQIKDRASYQGQTLKPGADRDRASPRTRLPGLRWVPVPLAVLAAVIGTLVIGSLQGQVQAANANRAPRYEAGGLSLTVGETNWMNNSMTGQPAKAVPKGYSMPSSEMPGMQAVGDNRLRVEVDLSNVSGGLQRYSMNDFKVISRDGKTWHVNPQGYSNQPASANLRPGFGTVIDMYFDMPAKDSKNLTLTWSRDGTTISIPVNTGTAPSGMHM
ncbi:MAG TPA: hypothetical protein VFQ44_00255 [Streptosporangiaceae bacterium]|nr:hypothetical protein [Streptosporangiaceae bacterium]